MIINNKEDYWACVDKNWNNILGIFTRVGMQLTGLQGAGQQLDKPLYQHLEELRSKRSPEIVQYFDWVWGVAPDSPIIHRWAGWFELCDLCSESWVFETDEPQEEAE